jgi:hypothetical protein
MSFAESSDFKCVLSGRVMSMHGFVIFLLVAAPRFFGCAEADRQSDERAAASTPQDAGAIDHDSQSAGDEARDDTVAQQDEGAGAPTPEELLDRLEAAATDLNSFQANISFRETDAVFGGVTIRTGQVIFVSKTEEAGKRFAILFKQEIKDGALRDYNEHFIFDGEWLVQKNFDNKDFIKRQVVPPGDEFDPLRLGEGPFPLPIGQKKADVVARFEVGSATLPDDEKDYLASKLEDDGVWGLTLVPRAGTTEAEDFEKITVFYDRATLLPAGIDVVRTGGEREQVLLLSPVRNGGVDESVLDTTVPESGWRVDIRPWRGE